MNEINYVVGDATQPQGDGIKIIPHICNNKNRWGAGFVLAISRRWEQPKKYYRGKENYILGDVDIVQVEEDVFVANMIAQHNIGYDKFGKPPIRYNALEIALQAVNKFATTRNASLHAPMFGTGLGGGQWDIIEEIIKSTITVPITIYVLNEKDLPKK